MLWDAPASLATKTSADVALASSRSGGRQRFRREDETGADSVSLRVSPSMETRCLAARTKKGESASSSAASSYHKPAVYCPVSDQAGAS